ncbi:MAG: multiprotein-bridging factor 1 family protein [Candidatus Marsarchaeota archaeon]|jgi:putative transcription factor|nr:multiprotein-bridging factor 1 family protein [Candidatus Marsarchaeota archaeon]MCL5111428.1 multiprotein-bridging factor 1 family protein [Candidatus Marsarchaeota archaeon]
MEECELCGRQMKDAYIVSVEGADLRVCSDCAKGKKVLYKEVEERKNTAPRKTISKGDDRVELVEGYGKMIHAARDQMQLPLKVLAEMINEKEAHMLRVEEEKTRPSIELTKKIERALNIKITQQKDGGPDMHVGKKSGGATIGDFFNV